MVKEKPRNSGLDIVGNVPWGMHFCQFYQTKEELMEILAPYFKAGLDNNELCVWIVSQISDIEEAKEALKKLVPEIDFYLDKGQIEIIPHTEWYFKNGVFSSKRILEGRVGKHNQALASGYEGLRLTEDIFLMEEIDWGGFDYEKELNRMTGKCPIINLCTYPLEKCSATGIIDVIADHQFALIKTEGKWQLVENSIYKKPEETEILTDILELSDDAIITGSLDGIITSWNKGAARMYGYSAKEVLGKPISILEPSILVEETEELIELIKYEEKIHHYETLQLRKDGKIINVLLTLSTIFDASENPTAILAISRDITENEQAAENLLKSKQIYRVITEQTGQLVYEYDFRTDKCSWAGAIKEVTGYSSEELQLLGKYVWNINIRPLNPNNTRTGFQSSRFAGDRYKEELKFRKKDGTYIDIENRGIYLRDHEGRVYEAIGVIKDITDWKLALKKVKESEEKYRSFIQNFNGIVYQRDENFIPIYLHGAVEEMTGHREKDFGSLISWKELIYPDDLPLVLKEKEKVQNFQSTGYGNIEYRIRRRDGQIKWVHEIYQKIKKTNEKPEFYQGTIYDVTERKETEAFLENIGNARKKEIHHRIKNNLQVISSLLDLQAEKFRDKECIKDSEVLEAFVESQNRVLSMSLIHEELYKGKGTDMLNFSEYIRKLSEKLLQTYNLNDEKVRLYIDMEENAFFDMDIAVPLGIIINELVSNSLKYAFTEEKEGEIRIILYREEKNNETHQSLFSLTISDNGKGIPESLELENVESLGLQLVSILTDQLDGEIKLIRDHGTEFTITFEVNEKP
jgi:PAS domain S-box-containing protein